VIVECIITGRGCNIPITAIPVVGSAQTPEVRIQETFEDQSIECFKATKRSVAITLENVREIKTAIKWGYKICNDVPGSDDFTDEDVLVDFSCDEDFDGMLDKLQTKQFDIQITCSKVGNLLLDVYCSINGMVENGGNCRVSLPIKCLGLSVAIEIPEEVSDSSFISDEPTVCEIKSLDHDSSEHNLSMNFNNVSLLEIKKRSFTIKNTSGVTSSFKIAPTEYTTTPVSEVAKEGVFAHEAGIFSHRAMEKMSSLPMETIGFTTEKV
jgi:hypothetical protein